MKESLDKFIDLKQKLSLEKGEFTLFALFLREDAPNKWDFVVAAPWIDADRKSALPYIAHQIQKTFKPNEIVALSRIVLIEKDNPGLSALQSAINIVQGTAEYKDCNLFGLQIKHAYILVSQRINTIVEALQA